MGREADKEEMEKGDGGEENERKGWRQRWGSKEGKERWERMRVSKTKGEERDMEKRQVRRGGGGENWRRAVRLKLLL